MSVQQEIELPPYRFFERRAGAGTPVVLIHGLGGSSDWWLRNYDALAREHLVSAVDLVGFGRTRFFLRKSSLPPSFAETAALLTRWIESSFTEPVHLVGNSMGGHIAIHVAAQRPDLVRSLILVNSTGIPFEMTPGAHAQNLMVPRGALSFGRILARDAFRSGPTAVAVAFARLLRDDARQLMRGLHLPTLVVWGERDPLVPLKYGEQIVETIPEARLVVIPRAGHIPMWENPEVFNAVLVDFLREVDRNPSTVDRELPTFSWSLSGWTDGIAHRQAGRDRDIVLIHGLGMSSAYFGNFARPLFNDGWNAIAPDLPGFGDSVSARSMTPGEQAQRVILWADALRIRDAVWVGHSMGCNVVAHVAQQRPDLCRAAVMIGPLWTRSPHPILRLCRCLVLDAFQEPLRLFGFVIPAYWRAGFGRWWMSFRRAVLDMRSAPPADATMIAGTRDPLPDRTAVPKIIDVSGAHACHFSHPEEVARVIASLRRSSSSAPRRS